MHKLLLIISFFLISIASNAEDFADIKQLALLSAASYQSPQRLPATLNKLGYQLIHQNDLPGTELRYFIARSQNGNQYVAFRGTSNVENALVDLDLAFAFHQGLKIQLHQGFANAASAAFADMRPYLDKTQPIRTTGHSLGGAIAVITAMQLQREGYNLGEVVTFGQPKVTNLAGANAFSSLPVTRVVTPKDLVPLVPPLSPLQLRDLDIYWHVGREIILLVGNKYSVTEGVKSMLRATKFMSSVPDESHIDAHQMATYLGLINNKLNGAQLETYSTGINAFGFSLN